MQHVAQRLRTAEEHARVRWAVNLPDGFENGIPVGAPKVGGRSQSRDGVGFGVGVIDHYVRGIVRLDVGSKILSNQLDKSIAHGSRITHRVDLNVAIHVFRLNRHEQRSEPLKRPKVPANPEEIHLPESSPLLRIFHPIPNTLKDGRKRGHANTGSYKHRNLVLEHVFRCTPKWPIDVDARQNFPERRVHVGVRGIFINTDHSRSPGSLFLASIIEITADGVG